MALLVNPQRRVHVLFGLLFCFQAVVLVGALTLFTGLPRPEGLSSLGTVFASSGLKGPEEEDILLRLAFEEKSAGPPAAADAVLHKITSGQTLASIWALYGASRAGALLAAKAFREAGVSPASLKLDEELELVVSPGGDVTGLKRKLEDGRTLLLQGDSLDGYEWSLLPANIEENYRTVSGTILSSFSAAASERGIPYAVIDDFVDLFGGRIEFNRNVHPGDTFTVRYRERIDRQANRLLSAGPIITASLQTRSALLAAIQHIGSDGKSRYFDEEGNPLGNYFLRYPLKFTRISSAFTWARFHPILQRTRPHLGIDFAAPRGTPVRAVADGVVSAAGFIGEGGNTVKISHCPRWSTAYLHLDKISTSVRRGGRVSRGQIIGTVGSTGLSTGPHLHYSLFDRGKYVNPFATKLPSMPSNVDPIPQAMLAASMDEIRQQHAIIAMAAAVGPSRS